MDKKTILLFSGAGAVILGIIIFTVALIVGMQNKPVNIVTTSLTNNMAYNLLEGYCNVKDKKANKYVNNFEGVSEAYKMIIEEAYDVILASDIDEDTLDWIKGNDVEVEVIPIAS